MTQKRKKSKTKKTGRPKLPEGEARDRVVKARFTASEQCQIEQSAAAANLTVTDWVRKMLLDGS